MTSSDYDERSVRKNRRESKVIEHKPSEFYNVPRGGRLRQTSPRRRYKGNFWSKMKGRDDERTSATLGPGDYEHETKKSPGQICNEKAREKRAATKQLRSLGTLRQQKLRQNLPAPERYDLPKGVFNKRKCIPCKCDPLMVDLPSFDRTAKRFEENFQLDTPGPGTYEIMIPQICYGSILHAPFGAFSARFKRRIIDVTPGPADYHTEVGTLAFESAKRFKEKCQKTFDYLKLCKILTTICDDDEYTIIDKCKVAKETDEGKYPVYHAVFKSKVDRFPKISKKDDVPDSGAYEVLSAFKANRDRCDFLCRRLAPPFGSRASRFPMVSKRDFCSVPGPAHYDLRGDISKNVKNGVMYSAPREKKEDIEGPGPMHYHLHPYIASSVLKKSFNVTLGKPKTIEKISKIKTPRHYRRLKKTLRWFAIPRERYQHCVSFSERSQPGSIQRNTIKDVR